MDTAPPPPTPEPNRSTANTFSTAKPSSLGRSHTTTNVFGSLKWWSTSSNRNNQTLPLAPTGTASASSSSTAAASSTAASGSPQRLQLAGASSVSLFGSSGTFVGRLSAANGNQQHHNHQHPVAASLPQQLAVQKLRESKWFTVDETRILCAVLEPGFVVEIREGQENESSYGVVLFKASKDKKPKPQDVEIFTIRPTSAATATQTGRLLRVARRSLADLWLRGCTVRIQNFGDREHRPHSEKDIRNQIAFAQKAKQMIWPNSQHFAFWCRYGERQQDIRRKQVDAIRNKYPLGIVH